MKIGPKTRSILSKPAVQPKHKESPCTLTIGSEGAFDGIRNQFFYFEHLVLLCRVIDKDVNAAKCFQVRVEDLPTVVFISNVASNQVDLALALGLDSVLGIQGILVFTLVTVNNRYTGDTLESKQGSDGTANTTVGTLKLTLVVYTLFTCVVEPTNL